MSITPTKVSMYLLQCEDPDWFTDSLFSRQQAKAVKLLCKKASVKVRIRRVYLSFGITQDRGDLDADVSDINQEGAKA